VADLIVLKNSDGSKFNQSHIELLIGRYNIIPKIINKIERFIEKALNTSIGYSILTKLGWRNFLYILYVPLYKYINICQAGLYKYIISIYIRNSFDGKAPFIHI